MQKLWAFWKYDRFPFLLHSEVSEFLDAGRVKVKGFHGMSFRYSLILPEENAKEFITALEDLEIEYRERKKSFEQEFKKRLDAVYGKFGYNH